MLIEAPYKSQDTVTVKTTAGDELVGRFIEENDKEVVIEKPLALMATAQGMGLAPFAFTIPPDARIKLNRSAVLFVHKTETEMAKQYVQNVSGIQMV